MLTAEKRQRETNRQADAKRFSTVPAAKRGADNAIGHGRKAMVREEPAEAQAASSSSSFDPIKNDPMFVIVEDSKYWPPPPLSTLLENFQGSIQSEGGKPAACRDPAKLMDMFESLDMYDRRADDKTAEKKVRKQAGQLQHPRGKAPQNTKVTFDEDGPSTEQNAEEH